MKRTIRIIFLILFIWLAFSMIATVNAASATIKADKTSVETGEKVTVTVTVNAAAWNLKVSGSASGDIIGYNSDAENETTTKTYNIDTSKAGTYKVTLAGDITDESKDNADEINTSVSITVKAKETTTDKKEENLTNKDTTSSEKNITVDKETTTEKKEETTPEKPKEKSNNAYLSTLGVTPKEYDFSGFNKTKTEYSVTIPKNVDLLKVLYKTADANAKVKVSGNSGFEVGSDNKITIKVTAEDGKTTQTYTIKVTQLAEEEEKPGNIIEEETELYLESLSVKGLELTPEFAKDVYSYRATLDDADINELEVKAEANLKEAKVDISGNTNLVEGENTINILVTVEGSTVQKVYQIIVTKDMSEITTGAVIENNGTSDSDLIGKIKQYAGIAIGVIVLIVVGVIVLIILLVKENKKINEEDEEQEIQSAAEYNVYDTDENEFVNTDIKRDNFIESLYKQRNGNIDDEDFTQEERETLEEITRQTEKIFEEKIEGQSVEYTSNDTVKNPLERRRKRRKGKHCL